MLVRAGAHFFAATMLIALCAAGNDMPCETQQAFIRFTDIISVEGGVSDTPHHLGVETRRTLVAPTTVGPSIHHTDDDGAITLSIADDIPPIASDSKGIILKLQYYDGITSLFSTKRDKHVYYSKAELGKSPVGLLSCMSTLPTSLTLRPYGAPTEQVRVYARQALSRTLRLEAPPVEVPPDARLDFAVALQKEWRIAPDAQAGFRILVETEEDADTIYEEIVQRHAPIETPCWRERSIALDAYAGEEVQFVFESEGLCDDPLAFPLWANPILYQQRQESAAPLPNIILIALDTLRADHLGCYGYKRDTSPNIDLFAQDSVLFEQAIAPAPWTTPSFGSIFTGKHPGQHKAGWYSQGFVLQPRFTTLATLASERGLLTAAFTEGVAVRGPIGFARGFDRYSDGKSPESHQTGTAEHTFRQAAAWLERYGRLPFFLFVHTYEPHEPYDAPEPWKLKFADANYRGRPITLGQDAETEEEKQHIRDRYDGCIAYTDHWTGWFLDRLDSLGLRDNTVVILLSDHGEEFWEHGEFGHTLQLYDEVLWTPLIIRMPGNAHQSQRVSRQVTLTDIFATVLDLLEISVTGVYDSHSLMPLIRNAGDDAYQREKVVSELVNVVPGANAQGNYVEFLMRSIRFPHVKYISGDRDWAFETLGRAEGPAVLEEELYKLDKDPGETNDLAETDEEALQRLRQLLANFLQDQGIVDDEASRENLMDTMHEDDVQALRALGYL